MLPGEQTVWKETYGPEDLEEVACPLCGGTETAERARQFGLRVVQCRRCGLQYVNPRVRDPERNYWGDIGALERKYAQIFEGRSPHPRDENYREHLRVLEAFRGEGRLLDIGTHAGFFLRRAREAGWKVVGVEPSPTNAALAREKFGLPIIAGYLPEARFPDAAFDVVTLVDVLEHVTSPVALLREVHRVLRVGGVAFIKTPNVAWNRLKYLLLGEMLGRRGFDFFDIREHVVQYDQSSLHRLLRTCGFRPLRWYVPRPVQHGPSWRRATRSLAWLAARAVFDLTGWSSGLSPDLAVIAVKP